MPIYAYKCSSCGHGADVIQKLSDAPLTVCTACGETSFSKQITAAGFQLKGSGWYATDFKNGAKGVKKDADSAEKPAEKSGEAKPAEVKASESKTTESSTTEKKTEAKTDTKANSSDTKPAARQSGGGGRSPCS